MDNKNITEFTFKEGIARAYGLYAMSVIKGRALPNLKDGLKPVQRRILFAMYEAGFRYKSPFKKSARIIGDVVGKYHPHGDSSVYEALVHMEQDFIMSIPLIQGQGNFGSIDGDRAAAFRYTQVRLAHISEYLLADYDKNTVEMKLNYDETLEICDVLPAQFPNLLVNGANGIAVGMATSIPPHNLGEILDAVIYMVDNENADLSEIMQFVKGPDFPTKGEFFGGADLKRGYETGKGRIILRGVIEEEEIKGKPVLIITEVPYQTSKPKIIEKIVSLIDEGALEDISDIRDESSAKIRVVIELKRGANVDIIKQRIFGLTNMQISVSLNMVAIYENKPDTFSLKQILSLFLKFREEVVVKRAEFLLSKYLNKIHITWGLVLATQKMDKVIQTIRSSSDVKDAERNLMEIEWHREEFDSILEILGAHYIKGSTYNFSLEQVKGILDLKLQKLTKLEKNSLLEELKELYDFMKAQNEIIVNRDHRKMIMKQEFLEIKNKFAVPRRTKQISMIDNFCEEDLIESEEIVVMTTANDYIKRVKLEEYRVQNRGGKGKIGHKKLEDPITNLFTMNTLTNVLFFTNFGKVFSMKAYQIPESALSGRGRACVNLFKLELNEKITTILPLEDKQVGFLFFVTKKGTVRKNDLEDFQNIRVNGKIAMKLEDGNALHSVFFVEDKDEVLLTSSSGNAIRFSTNDIRCFESRSSEGIRGMTLEKGDYIVGSAKITPNKNAEILCVTENGFGKRSSFDQYRLIKRGGKGSKVMNLNSKTGSIVAALYVETDDDILLMSKMGKVIRVKMNDVRQTGRVTSGVYLIKLQKDLLTQAIRVKSEPEDDQEEIFENLES